MQGIQQFTPGDKCFPVPPEESKVKPKRWLISPGDLQKKRRKPGCAFLALDFQRTRHSSIRRRLTASLILEFHRRELGLAARTGAAIIGCLAARPVFGWLQHASGSYVTSFIAAAAIIVGGRTGLVALERRILAAAGYSGEAVEPGLVRLWFGEHDQVQLLERGLPVAFDGLITDTASMSSLIALAGVTGLPLEMLSAAAGRILPIFSLIVPFWIIWTMAGRKAMLEVWPACLVAGGSFAITQLTGPSRRNLGDDGTRPT